MIVLIPLIPDNGGTIYEGVSSSLRIVVHYQLNTISQGENSIFNQLLRKGINASEYIQFYSLRNHDLLNGMPVTESIYIHSKIMIVDDDIAIIGSANINDRSLLGSRDSEIAMVIKDDEKINSSMNSSVWRCGKFTSGLRRELFKLYLGSQEINVNDPLSDDVLQRWDQTAKNNTLIYRKVFGCYPDNEYKAYDDVKRRIEYQSSTKGIEEMKSNYQNENRNIRGFLVEYPTEFLVNEDLSAKFFSPENILPASAFT